MKKNYILLLLAMSAGTAQAQLVRKAKAPGMVQPAPAVHVPPTVKPPAGVQKDAGDIVFSEDFANGLAGNNTFGEWTTGGANGNLWKHSFLPPNGAYTNAAEVIESTSAANGWMLLACDSANTDWSDTTIVASPTNWDAGLQSPELDLTANPYVRVEFETAGRWCCNENPFYVQVSVNGGVDWIASYQAFTAAVNAGTGTVTRSVNISGGVLQGPSTVTFRFMWDGATAASSHYYWQIDDVKLVVVEDTDLALNSANNFFFDINTAFTYDSLKYTVYPYSQLRPLPLHMSLSNNGSVDQTGVTANFTVISAGNTILDQDQNVDLPAGITETVFVNPDFVPPATAGTYNVTYTATSTVGDVTPNNNTATSSFKVSEFVYSRDGGTTADYNASTGLQYYEACNAYHIANEVELYSIDVLIRSGGDPSPVGFPILGVLYSDLENPINETAEHTILSNELNASAAGTKVINLIFDEPQLLEAGLDYIVCLKHYGDAELRCAINGESDPQTSFIYFDPESPDQGEDWYYTTETPMVRMNFNPSVGIDQADVQDGVGMGQNFPNPVNGGTTTVPYSLVDAANVSIEVRDVSGKLVDVQNLGKRSPGTHRAQLNTANLNEGVYFYSLVADDVRLTKRMTVLH